MASSDYSDTERPDDVEDAPAAATISAADGDRDSLEEKEEQSRKFFSHLTRSFGRFVDTVRQANSDDQQLPYDEKDLIEVRFVNKETGDTDFVVPRALRMGAAYSWRLLLIAAVLYLASWVAVKISIIIIPLLLSLLFAVLLEPIMKLCVVRLKLPRVLAAIIALVIGIGVVVGLVGVASSQLYASMTDVVDKAQAGVNTMIDWASTLHKGIDISTVEHYWRQTQIELETWLKAHSGSVASGAVGAATTAVSFASGMLMVLFCLFFFLKDGRTIWQWVLRLIPREMRHDLNEAAIRGWVTLGSYARTQMAVAAIDAVGIGVGASFLVGVSLAIPLGVLVFIGAFIPIVGAITTGAIAVFVALVVQGFKAALWMLLIILLVQQIESNILHPFMMSSAVSLHPIVVLLAVVAGGYVAGIIGAMFSVPFAAFINTTVLYLTGHDKFLRLNFDHDRPGGPPGSLEEEMRASLQPSTENLQEAARMREKAIENGYLTDDDNTHHRREESAQSSIHANMDA
ncbi:MAG: AI-2E family transporter [Actinomycetaceae bacterium]|nr:AI-2E family transporter [Actinomycetaceae bacterium]